MSIEYGSDGLPSGISSHIGEDRLDNRLTYTASQVPVAADWALIERKMSLLEHRLNEALDTVRRCKRYAHSKLEEL
ncbi:hypothetical protein [Bifidobacterium sp. ESL0790]|uniref:hypothetical protein n=1 Tax=Bifidobacterium sp. ESL0790 TaxID=2983233 RepID=UPI0023F6B2EE|nr:hypothetical protein [Bifidobacterium sp. ESL0790]WEV72135.1 hypothetical protein OZY47_06760 [Bifidobacterium sp. ESL0790]